MYLHTLKNKNFFKNKIQQKLDRFSVLPVQIKKPSTAVTALNLLFTSENASYEITEDDNDKTKTVLLHKEDNIENSNKLQLQVMQLKQQVKNLNSQLSVQNQLVNNYKRKYSKRESVIRKLRLDVSQLKKERRKLRQREYMRKFKQKKNAERRKERRIWLCKQIESGKMDKSCLALVYSRKSLPFEKKSQELLTSKSVQLEQLYEAETS